MRERTVFGRDVAFDVREAAVHAYYIDYRNERPRFASSVLSNIVNWDFVAQNLDGQGFERANQSEGARSPELTA